MSATPTSRRGPSRSRRRTRGAFLALACAAAAGCLTINPNAPRGLRDTEAGRGTAPQLPPFEPSDEATAEELERARDQGNAVTREFDWVREHEAVASAEMAVGEYRVAYAITPALPYAEPDAGGRLVRHDPRPGEVHLGVVVRDAADGRLVPGLAVRVTLVDASGRAVDARPLPYGWYPLLNRYGDNLRWPGLGAGGATAADGAPVTVRVDVAPPTYWRHDPSNGDRFADSVTAEFTRVTVHAAALARAAAAATSPAADTARRTLAAGEGAALARSLAEMASNVAVSGASTRAGEYLPYVAFERAEGYWEPHGTTPDGIGLRYTIEADESAERNAHLEIGVRDSLTGRFIPGLRVRGTVLDARGRTVGTYEPPFMWHSWIHHYGMNFRVARSGAYRVRVHADPPAYRRYGPDAERVFVAPLDAEIDHLKIVTGQK